MSPPQDVPPAAPGSTPPQFYPVYPVQFHPEFGYLAPTIRFRRKVSLLGKGLAVGAMLGAIAAIAMLPDPDVRVGAALSMQSQAAGAGDELRSRPVAFVAPTLALPAATLHSTPMRSASAPAAAAAAVGAAPAALPPAPDAASEAADAKPAPRPKKRVARQPRQPRNARAAESDPRSAYAGPFRQSGDPRRSADGRRPFGFGW
jgi:hypothetical protein